MYDIWSVVWPGLDHYNKSSRSVVKSKSNKTKAFLSKHLPISFKQLIVVVLENEGDRNAKQFVCGARPPLSQLHDPVCLLNGSSAMFPLIMTSMKVKNVRCGFSWRQLTPRHRDSGCFINDGGETTN